MSRTGTAERDDRDLGDALLATSLAYRVLSQALVYPTPDAVEALRREDLPLAEAVEPLLPRELQAPFGALRLAFHGVRRSRLEATFRQVFSHVHSADCPAYETDLAARDVFRQSQQLADLAGFYRAFGLGGSELERERPDHISVELEFLHVVAYKEAWALMSGDGEGAELCREAEAAFLRDHALAWMPEFARRLEALAGDGPYAAAARLLMAVLERESHRLGVTAGDGPDPGPGHPAAAVGPPIDAEPLEAMDPVDSAVALCEDPP